jgi:hypothetical protein
MMACHNDNEYSYPLVYTGEVTAVSPNGATFNGKITDLSKERVISFGFVWGSIPGPTVEGSEKYEMQESPKRGPFSQPISTTLQAGIVYHVRAYARSSHYTTYGKEVTFTSLGSLAPNISDFMPKTGNVNDTLTIIGKNFSYTASVNIVQIGPFQATVIHANQDTLLVRVPSKLNTPSSTISVSIQGNSNSSKDNFNLIPPVITGFSPTMGTFGSQVTINGDNFTANPKSLHVYVGRFEANLNRIEKQHVTITIPDSLNTRRNNIKVVMNNLSVVSSDLFQMEHVTINDFAPKTATTGMTITLRGGNFSPIAANNSVIIGGLKGVVTQASISTLSVTLPLQNVGYYSSRNVKINVEVMGENSDYTDLLYIKDQWFRHKDAPIELTGSFSTVVNDKLYVGINDNRGFWTWSPTVDQFIRLSNFPGPARSDGNGFAIGNSIYFGTGLGFSSNNMVDFWSYDISSDAWTQKSNFAGAGREGSFAFSVNGSGYLGGGQYNYPGIYYGPYDDLWNYNPSNDHWAKLTGLVVGPGVDMWDAITVVVGNDVYVGLGQNYIATPAQQDQRWFKYNAPSNTWSPLAIFPFSRQYEKAIAFNLNGIPYAKTIPSGFYFLNYSTGSWQSVDTQLLPGNVSGIGFAIGTIAYIGIGKALWEYDNSR